MCDPISMISLALTAGSTLFGLAQKPPEPPAVEQPAAPAPTARTPGATVRIGDGVDEMTNEDPNESGAKRLPQTRAAGTALGGLGRSTLAL